MAEQLWKGRFSKAVDSRVNDFNSSIRFDQRMIAQDMRGSGVHAAMLAKQGIISEKDCEEILNGLASIADDLASGKLEIDPNAEDVHTFVEQTLTARIGDAGKRLHTGRSRNDQVALDIRLTLRDYSHMLQGYIVELVKVICKKAAENTTAVMPGYTHLQRAQPITFGHALMAYAWMLLRDLQRFGAENFTNVKGVFVPVKETIRGFKAILDGEMDAYPEAAFFNVGTIEDVKKKAETL